MSGDTRKVTHGDDRVVVVTDSGVTVYPAREPGDRWRAVWYENGRRRQCEAASEDRLAARLEKVTVRLAADAPNLERPGPFNELLLGFFAGTRAIPRRVALAASA